jgi:hypothetical protein
MNQFYQNSAVLIGINQSDVEYLPFQYCFPSSTFFITCIALCNIESIIPATCTKWYESQRSQNPLLAFWFKSSSFPNFQYTCPPSSNIISHSWNMLRIDAKVDTYNWTGTFYTQVTGAHLSPEAVT